MVWWRGNAEFAFDEQGELAMARAVEEAHTDVDHAHPEAWVIEDRRISFHLELDSDVASLDAHKRLLSALAHHATSGEALLFIGSSGAGNHATPYGLERWHRAASSCSVNPEEDESRDTIRTEAG
jgi:hypothetical protein